MESIDQKDKGKITIEYWISCGLCDTQEAADGEPKSKAIKTILAKGYKRTHKYGWVCPTCIATMISRKRRYNRPQVSTET